jgi:butyryl-CoA dehydrogenase
MKDPEEAGAAATDYLNLFAYTALAYMWVRMTEVSLAKLDDDPTGFHEAKLATARFFFQRLLPKSSGHFSAIMAGKAPLMAMKEAAF